jgi:hypothetical protein
LRVVVIDAGLIPWVHRIALVERHARRARLLGATPHDAAARSCQLVIDVGGGSL